MIISSILAVVVFAVMFIMAARDKLSRPAVMGMSAVGAVLLLFGVFIGLSRSDDQMLIAQIAAVLIFVVMFVLIIMDKIERHIVTLCCGLATLVMVFGICLRSFDAVWSTLNIANIFTPGFWYTAGASEESSSGINWATIIFIAGMMIMVEGMAKAGFFRWLCMTLAKHHCRYISRLFLCGLPDEYRRYRRNLPCVCGILFPAHLQKGSQGSRKVPDRHIFHARPKGSDH